MKKVYFKLLEILCTAAGTSYNLPTDTVLKDSQIVGIESYSLADVGLSPKGAVPVNNTVFNKSFITLVKQEGSVQMIAQLPLTRIRSANNNGERFLTEIDNINPSDCKIDVASSAALVAGEAFLIGVYYTKC